MTAQANPGFFQERLREALKEARRRGLNQEELAERIGVSKNTIGLWKKGTHEPQYKNLTALSAELGIPVEDLTEGKSKAAPATDGGPTDVLKRLAELELLDVFERLRRVEPEIQQLAGAIPDLMSVLAEAQRRAED